MMTICRDIWAMRIIYLWESLWKLPNMDNCHVFLNILIQPPNFFSDLLLWRKRWTSILIDEGMYQYCFNCTWKIRSQCWIIDCTPAPDWSLYDSLAFLLCREQTWSRYVSLISHVSFHTKLHDIRTILYIFFFNCRIFVKS